jgi:hypothetical protein
LYILQEHAELAACSAIQIEPAASPAHDHRVLALFFKTDAFVYHGKYYSAVRSEDAAAALLQTLFQYHQCQQLTVVEDTASPFFAIVPPWTPLPPPRWSENEENSSFPQLLRLHLDTSSQNLSVVRLTRRCQNTLLADQATRATFILDLYDHLLIREPADVLTDAFKQANEAFTQQYRARMMRERQLDCLPAVETFPVGQEPAEFVQYFYGWRQQYVFEDPRIKREEEERQKVVAEQQQLLQDKQAYDRTTAALLKEIPQSIFLNKFLIESLDIELPPNPSLDNLYLQLLQADLPTSGKLLDLDADFLADCLLPIAVTP